MLCPTCQQSLQKQNHDSQEVYHCGNCGSTFFDENSLNRITIKTAEKLASDKKLPINSPAQLPCPVDNIFMLPLEEEAVPKQVRLYRCEICKGLYGSAEDIVTFKKAQFAKINYFKAWQIPIPAMRAVMVFSFIALMSLGLVLTSSQLQNRNLTNSQASDMITTISATKSNQYLILTFKTGFQVKSEVKLIEKTSGEIFTKEISTDFSTTHQMATGELDLSKKYDIQIILTDRGGNKISTEIQPLVIE